MIPISEAAFQQRVIEYALLKKWKVHHSRRALDPRKGGLWRTAIEGVPGFPDLVLVREKLIFAELKSEKGRLSPEQVDWIAHLKGAGARVYLWRPSDWEQVLRVLA